MAGRLNRANLILELGSLHFGRGRAGVHQARMTPFSTNCKRRRGMPSPSNGEPDCRGCATSSQMLMFSPKSLVPTRFMRKDRWSRMARPPKSQNMKPAISRTAAGSRMTVCLPAGISRGAADFAAFPAAISASPTASRLSTFGRVGLLPSRGIACQHGNGDLGRGLGMPSGKAARVENRFHGFRGRKNACGGEFMLLCDADDPLHGVGAPLGGNGRGLVEMTPRS